MKMYVFEKYFGAPQLLNRAYGIGAWDRAWIQHMRKPQKPHAFEQYGNYVFGCCAIKYKMQWEQ
ncbi:MAG: hypothetical protein BHW37_05090 [Firmicutes bacterium CAG:272_52_7]|nr:MAG: hypothetical protein BHW37_05090 [Firmicutes bacterium CAG:272_52_7]